MRVIKLLLYSGILALSGILPMLRFLDARQAWLAPVKVAEWLPSPAVLWWIVPAGFWLVLIDATLRRRALTQRFYGALLGVAVFGGGAAGGALGPPKPLPNHPDLLLIDQARGVQLQLERHFVDKAHYPKSFRYQGPVLKAFVPPQRAKVRLDAGRCLAVGELQLSLKPKSYEIRVCGLDGRPGGKPRHLRQHGEILRLKPNPAVQKALFMKSLSEPAREPAPVGPRRSSP